MEVSSCFEKMRIQFESSLFLQLLFGGGNCRREVSGIWLADSRTERDEGLISLLWLVQYTGFQGFPVRL